MTTQELAKLTPEEKRIRIAEACGWKDCGYRRNFIEDCLILGGVAPKTPDDVKWYAPIPDYLSDLNAMHEAEKVLSDEDWEKYANELLNLTGNYFWSPMRSTACATAAQRAEAFLLTVG